MDDLAAVDREIRQEGYDSERAIRVLDRICRNDPDFLRALWPFALSALVDARIKAIEPPKPESATKKGWGRPKR